MDIDELINNAEGKTAGKVEYVTHARLAITNDAVFIDFYTLMPDTENTTSVSAIHSHRIAMPLTSAKDTANKLMTLVSNSETSKPEADWSQLESLYGAWSDLADDDVEAWFNDLRSSNRLSDIYDDDRD